MAMQIPSTSLTLISPTGGSLTYRGRSRAGDGTAFVLQEMRWMFDMGALIQQVTPQVIFLTHTHNDHITFMPQILLKATKHVNVYLPTKALPFVERYLEAHRELVACGEDAENTTSTNSKTSESLPYTLHPVDFHQVFTLQIKGTTYTVKALQCDHRIDCLGFSIMRIAKTLKPEYANLPGRAIGNLRKQGVDVHNHEERPVLCHLGDTTHVVFERHPEILQQHRYIVVECTFFCEKTFPQAERTKHMHWKDLKPIVESHPHVLFILIHFSLRYNGVEIRNFFANATTTHNVHPVLMDYELRRGNAALCDCFHCEDERKMAYATGFAAAGGRGGKGYANINTEEGGFSATGDNRGNKRSKSKSSPGKTQGSATSE
jgi:ribonuclease Z